MNLHRLKIFESVSRHLNVTVAARQLNMSQPAVSYQLRLLEQEYNLKFYERSNRGMAMTPEGQDFLDAIRPLLKRIDEVERKFKNGGTDIKSSVLTVGGSNTLSVTVLPEILLNFRARHPDVQLVMQTRESTILETDVLSSEVEIALITNPSHFPGLVYVPYRKYEAVAFVGSHSTVAERPLTLAELTAFPLIVRRKSIIAEEIKKRGHDPHIAIECDAPEAVKAAVQLGLGVGLLFKGRVEQDIESGDLRLLDVPEMKDIMIESFIVYDGRTPLSMNAQDFLRTLNRNAS